MLLFLALIIGCDTPTTEDRPYDLDRDGVWGVIDCDDDNPEIGRPLTYWIDVDADGHGSWDHTITSCDDPGPLYLAGPLGEPDCDDNDPEIGPCSEVVQP